MLRRQILLCRAERAARVLSLVSVLRAGGLRESLHACSLHLPAREQPRAPPPSHVPAKTGSAAARAALPQRVPQSHRALRRNAQVEQPSQLRRPKPDTDGRCLRPRPGGRLQSPPPGVQKVLCTFLSTIRSQQTAVKQKGTAAAVPPYKGRPLSYYPLSAWSFGPMMRLYASTPGWSNASTSASSPS